MYQLYKLFFLMIYANCKITKHTNIILFNSPYFKRQNLVRNQFISNKTLSAVDNVFSLNIKYSNVFKSKNVKGSLKYILTFFLPEKQYIEMENIIEVEEGKQALTTYNEYIYEYNLKKLILLELEDHRKVLNKLQLINKTIGGIYDKVIKQEQEIRNLETQLDNLNLKIRKSQHNFSKNSFNLFQLPTKEKTSYFILPIRSIDMNKIVYYINNSFPVQRAYLSLKEANENIHNNLKFSHIIQSNGIATMDISYMNNLHIYDIVLIRHLHHTLKKTYYQMFFQIHNAYLILLSLKAMIIHEEKYLEFIQSKIEELLEGQEIEFTLQAISLKKKTWAIRKKILEMQFKQAKYIGIISANLVSLNYMKYIYYYQVAL